jgi:hypothetical protein
LNGGIDSAKDAIMKIFESNNGFPVDWQTFNTIGGNSRYVEDDGEYVEDDDGKDFERGIMRFEGGGGDCKRKKKSFKACFRSRPSSSSSCCASSSSSSSHPSSSCYSGAPSLQEQIGCQMSMQSISNVFNAYKRSKKK